MANKMNYYTTSEDDSPVLSCYDMQPSSYLCILHCTA